MRGEGKRFLRFSHYFYSTVLCTVEAIASFRKLASLWQQQPKSRVTYFSFGEISCSEKDDAAAIQTSYMNNIWSDNNLAFEFWRNFWNKKNLQEIEIFHSVDIMYWDL